MRKTETVIIPDDGLNRDRNKVFVVTEMPAFQAERWATRALIALARANPSIPDDLAALGWQGIAHLGMAALAGLHYEDAEPLLAEMMTCVKIMPDPNNQGVTRPVNHGGAEDIEEISTIVKLRAEVFKLHAGFFMSGGALASPPLMPQKQNSPNTPTSRHRSAR